MGKNVPDWFLSPRWAWLGEAGFYGLSFLRNALHTERWRFCDLTLECGGKRHLNGCLYAATIGSDAMPTRSRARR